MMKEDEKLGLYEDLKLTVQEFNTIKKLHILAYGEPKDGYYNTGMFKVIKEEKTFKKWLGIGNESRTYQHACYLFINENSHCKWKYSDGTQAKFLKTLQEKAQP